jgi:hypothetical protein
MEKRIKYGTILLIFLIIGLLVYGYFYHVFGDSPVPAKADRHISAHDLIALADTNEFLFDRQCLDKILSVGGIIKDIKRGKSGNYILSLGTNPGIPSLINCSLDSLYNHRSLSLKTGDSCSIRGRCAGHLENIILAQCIIEK